MKPGVWTRRPRPTSPATDRFTTARIFDYRAPPGCHTLRSRAVTSPVKEAATAAVLNPARAGSDADSSASGERRRGRPNYIVMGERRSTATEVTKYDAGSTSERWPPLGVLITDPRGVDCYQKKRLSTLWAAGVKDRCHPYIH